MNIEIAERLATIVDNTALLFAHQDEDTIAELLKAMRTDLRRGFGLEAHQAIEDIIRDIVVRRGEIEARCPSVVSKSIH